jgi:predicted HTH transcriptional regulator
MPDPKSSCIEFKPFIHPDDSSKLQEVVRSTIAFANKKGGTILLGVDDVCEVIGVEKEIIQSARKLGQTSDQAFERYMGTVRQVIANDINATPEITMEYVSLHNHKILVIRVPEGDRKPYWHIPTVQIYVRRGANTVKAHPEFDLPKLINSPSAQNQLFGQDFHQ